MSETYSEEELAEESEDWSGPSQDEWQNLVGFQQQVTPFLSELAQALQEMPPEQQQYGQQPGYYQPQPQEPEFDPFDVDSVRNYISTNINSGVEQALEPYSGILGIVASREGEQMAHNELEKIRQEVGEFDKDTAFLVASGLIDQGHEPAAALRRAAEFSRDVEKRIRDDERQRYTGEIDRIAGGNGDIPAGGSAAVEQPPGTPTGQDRYRIAIERALASRRPSMPIG